MSFRNYYESPSYGRSRERTTSSTSTERPTTVTAKYMNTTPSYKSSSIPVLSADRATKEDTPISTIANRYVAYNKTAEKPTVSKYDSYSSSKTEKPTATKYDSYSSSKTEKPTASKYDSYSSNKMEKPSSKYEKKDYSKLSVPSITITNKTRDVSPVPATKYNVNRPSRHLSPERRVPKNFKDKSRDLSPGNRDKDIPSKTDKSTSYSNLSSYKLYPRTSNYTRPVSRTEAKPELSVNTYSRPSSRSEVKPEITMNNYLRPSSRSETKAEISINNYTRPSRAEPQTDLTVNNYSRPTSRPETKPEITINRYAIANRLPSNYLRSPPTVKQTSVSPVNSIDTIKSDVEKCISPPVTEEPNLQQDSVYENDQNDIKSDIQAELENGTETITIVTRHTSPTPPGSSAYVRTRRADMAKTVEKTVTRAKRRPEMVDKEIQSDRLDDPTRTSRFGSTARTSMTNWSYYSPSSSNYTGYAGRYSTHYTNLRDNAGSHSHSASEKSGRSQSTEPEKKENSDFSNSLSEHGNEDLKNSNSINNLGEINTEMVSVYATEQNNGDNTSDVIINVNLKLKRAKSPIESTEFVSPEITITNSQLPPQAPKTEANVKIKKLKAKKTSSDSSTESGSKKKIIKKRSKSISSTDSEHGSESSEQISSPKGVTKTASNSNLQNSASKLRHSKLRDSNSPESSLTLSTQSSVSEDETISKSKTNEVSRTSADELSIPTDRSGKQLSPLRNETGTEDAKSFLIRALAPVTNLFKRHQENSENSRWLETSNSESTSKDVSNLPTESDRSSKGKIDTTNIIASNDDNQVQLKAIRPLESVDESFMLDSVSEKKNGIQYSESHKSLSNKNIARKIRHVESGERAWWMESNSINSNNKQECEVTCANSSEKTDSNKILKKFKFADDDKPWWLDSSANIPEGIERLSPPRKSSSDSEKSEKYNFFNVRRIESGDQKDWWISSNENSTNSGKLEQNRAHSQNLSKSDSERSFPLRRIRHVESGERPWWLSSSKNIPEGIEKLPTPPPLEESDSSDSEVQVYVPPPHIPPFPLHLPDDEPLGARRSPEGLETPKESEDYRGRASPYENNRHFRRTMNSYQKGMNKYISRYTDIDDILGTSGQIYSPFMDSILARRTGLMPFDDDECEEIDPTQVRIHDSTAQRPVIKKIRSRSDIVDCRDEDQLDDATLQVFKDGDYGPYLDLDSTLGEQDEELEGLQDSRKNALVLRTQLSVRVHAIIERLLHSQGRELRRALFTLKQILQSDKDLVHEFVANKGLDCLMQVGNIADHNYLDYILRALGQVLLYVDGMHGVMGNPRCVKWLYSQIAHRYRNIVKTSLKLLLVFVEYNEKNCLLLIDAIIAVDSSKGRPQWHNIMKILKDLDASDTELLIYATTLINRCLNNVPDIDIYYDQVDALQDQGIDEIIQLYMTKQGTDLDLLRQLQIFEAVLLYEDGDETGTAIKQLDDSVLNTIRRRTINLSTSERRKSKKRQIKEQVKPAITPSKPITINGNNRPQVVLTISDSEDNKELSSASFTRRRERYARQIKQQKMLNRSSDIYDDDLFNNTNGNNSNTNGNFSGSSSNFRASKGFTDFSGSLKFSKDGSYTNNHWNSPIPNENLNENFKSASNFRASKGFTDFSGSLKFSKDGSYTNNHWNSPIPNENLNENFKSASNSFCNLNDKLETMNGTKNEVYSTNENHLNGMSIINKNYPGVNNSINGLNHCNGTNGHQEAEEIFINKPTKNYVESLYLGDIFKNGNQRYTAGLKQRIQNGTLGHSVNATDAIHVMRQKQLDNTPEVKDDREILLNREHSIKDLAQRLTSPVSPTTEDKPLRVSEMAGIVLKAKEELAKSQSKEIIKSPSIEKTPKVHDIKVSENDLHWEELRKGCLHREYHLCDLDFSDLREDSDDDMSSPAVNSTSGPPPPPPSMFPTMGLPPPLPGCFPLAPKNNVPMPRNSLSSELSNQSEKSTLKKNKKTVKLFWKDIQENPTPMAIRPKVGGFIWDDLPSVSIDTNKLEHLFESRTNDLIIKKLMEPKRNLILNAKRSNAINIAMKKLPTPQTIKAAIMKMDATVIGREGIEKLLTMLPTEEEIIKIQEAQYANPDLPLGSAEQFLLTLASINELSSRLKLWVFKLDFDNLEKEIAEPLMDLKQGIELLKVNKTFKAILSTLRTVGNYLNGNNAKGFRLEYLSKVVEVKDTVHKHPLLYHVCDMIIENFPDSSDFFSEVGPVIRASKVDFDILSANLQKVESDCKASWDHMKRVAKHDGSQIFKTKINEFITDAAERIILLSIIKKRVMTRFHKFLLYLGVPPCDVHKTKPAEFLKVIAEFSLEYRTARERVLQQLEKKANHRERNKTRGKMIIDVGNYSNKNGDHTADSALKELLKSDPDTDSLTKGRRKTKNRGSLVNGDHSADDEILESLVRSATSEGQSLVRERRRNRISDRKNLNRTLNGSQT